MIWWAPRREGVMDEVTKNVRESGVKELFYTNDLVLLGDNFGKKLKRGMHHEKFITKNSMTKKSFGSKCEKN